jgi:uncharacterized protein (TIGR00730 family)
MMKSRLQMNNKYLNAEWTSRQVSKEIATGLKLLSKINRPIVTVLGSHKVTSNSPHFMHAKKLAFELSKQGFAIVTGGGPGIMKAANMGAIEGKGVSIGIKAALLKEERIKDNIFTKHLSYHFLFVRRFILSIKSDALVFYPGGYGTLNELFEYIVLMQIAFMDRVPIICIDKKFWKGLFDWLKDAPKKHGFYIKESDLDLIQTADKVSDIIRLIKNK